MKKVIVLNEEVKVLLEVKEVQSISAVSTQEEKLVVIGMNGQIKVNGKLKTGDISKMLPNTELGECLRKLWNYNQNYTFGTKSQMDILNCNNIKFDLRDRNSFNTALECLKENNLQEDRGVIFGKRTLVNPLPIEIIDLAMKIVA